jgi:hypothetical protein
MRLLKLLFKFQFQSYYKTKIIHQYKNKCMVTLMQQIFDLI